ncbi:MAG: tetratricopeptide repeat protein [Candidatus Thalassarchaeaceae archaeon]
MRSVISVLSLVGLTFFSTIVSAEEVVIIGTGDLNFDLMLPIIVGIITSLLLWRFLLPSSLSNLQVAFEIDDGFYEVHRLTKNRADALKIIRPRPVLIGVLLYLMAMAGILIIVTDVVDDSLIWNRGPTYYQPVLIITGLLLALPIVLSPFISLYAQISRKSAADSLVTLREWFLNVLSVVIVITVLIIPVAYLGLSEYNSVEDDTVDSMKDEWAGPGVFNYDTSMDSFVCIDSRGIHSPLPVIDVIDEESCNSQSQLVTDPVTQEVEDERYGRWVSNSDRIEINRVLIMIEWISLGLLVFMLPTIVAYGRIMGASWNMLVRNKYRTIRGNPTPIDPDKPSIVKRINSTILVIFLGTMPLAAVNGIITLAWTRLENPDNLRFILDLGGIIGNSLLVFVEGNEFLSKLVDLKSLSLVLAAYLMLNVSVVGLALIFEMIRNLFLGGQVIGGIGGVVLGQPREIRAESIVQSRIIAFGLAGFAGYSVLLLIMQVYKEWAELMPYANSSQFLTSSQVELMLLQETWNFIAVGQGVFILTWLLSIGRWNTVGTTKFDLAPDERRSGAARTVSGNWIRDYVLRAAIDDDIATLRRFQTDSISADESLLRLERTRARMFEYAMRGLWPNAIETAKTVLAQQGGEDDEARMIIAVGHIASRRLDAAKVTLKGLIMDDNDEEPELVEFVSEWLDPWADRVTDDDLYDWENEATIDHIKELQSKLESWDPISEIGHVHRNRLAHIALISSVAQMRAQRRSDEALQLAVGLVRRYPNSVRARIASALCSLDIGEWHDALEIFRDLQQVSPEDPRVMALSSILGLKADVKEFEVALSVGSVADKKPWLDQAPANAYVGLAVKGGMDEALNANALAVAHEAVERMVPPHISISLAQLAVRWVLLPLVWLSIGAVILLESGNSQYAGFVSMILLISHGAVVRFKNQAGREVKHRNQPLMVMMANRFKKKQVVGDPSRAPIGNHLLMSGILIEVGGIIFDVGLPLWLIDRNRPMRERAWKVFMVERMKSLRDSDLPRTQPLPNRWWLRRPKPYNSDLPAMERLVGSVHYRPMHRTEAPSQNKNVKGPPKMTKKSPGDLNVKFRRGSVTER